MYRFFNSNYGKFELKKKKIKIELNFKKNQILCLYAKFSLKFGSLIQLSREKNILKKL